MSPFPQVEKLLNYSHLLLTESSQVPEFVRLILLLPTTQKQNKKQTKTPKKPFG